MGWASGFSAGTNLGKTLVGTYNQAAQEDELRKIAEAKAQESQGFTADQGAQLEAAAKTGQYDIGYDEASKAYTVTPKSDPSQVGRVSMQDVTDFMGNRTAGRLDESQVNNAKLRAMAGVLGKTDPMQGARLLREVTQGERDDQRFKMETLNSERSGKMADLQLRAAEEAEKLKNMQRGIVEAVSGGPATLDEFYKNQYPDGFTSRTTLGPNGEWTIARMDSDGKVVSENKYANSIDLIGSVLASADPSKFVERAERKEKDAKTEARQGRLDDAKIDESNAKSAYYRSVAGAKAVPSTKLPEADSLEIEQIDKELGTINTAMVRVQAEGNIDPKKANPGLESLKERRLALMTERSGILSRVRGSSPGNDPIGAFSKPPSTTPDASSSGGASKPTRSISKKEQQRLDSDIPSILNAELVAAQKRLADGDQRAAVDISHLEKEISRLPGNRAPVSIRTVANPIPATKQPPQRPPSISAAISAPASPIDVAGANLDAARTAMTQAARVAQTYGLKQRREDPSGFAQAAQAVEQTRALAQQAEAEYRRLVEPVTQRASIGQYARP